MSAPIRPAATILLLRQGPPDTGGGVEVWLMERSRSVGFMASAWVFPGGRVDPGDADRAVRGGDFSAVPKVFWVAALRELEEEAGVRIGDGAGYDLSGVRVWSHWLTPEIEPRRYDTWFFAVELPPGAEPVADGHEAVAGRWFNPADAVAASMARTLLLPPPTIRTLVELAPYRTVAEALAAPRRTPLICPGFHREPGSGGQEDEWYVLLPGDPLLPSDDPVDPPHRFPIRGFKDRTLPG